MTTQKITLITGTSRGIGKDLAVHYLALGHHVIGCSRQELKWQPNGSYVHFCLDVTNEFQIKQMITSVRKNYGRLDHLINNAGIASMNHAILTPMDSASRVLQTNVLGTFLLCREAARLMQKNKFGRIVNFTTVASALKLEGEAIYAASKAAVLSLTQILAREFAPWQITVNAIGPTPIRTDLIGGVPEDKLQLLIKRQAIRRFGEFTDVSNVIDFYLRPESEFITGQNLYLGGV